MVEKPDDAPRETVFNDPELMTRLGQRFARAYARVLAKEAANPELRARRLATESWREAGGKCDGCDGEAESCFRRSLRKECGPNHGA